MSSVDGELVWYHLNLWLRQLRKQSRLTLVGLPNGQVHLPSGVLLLRFDVGPGLRHSALVQVDRVWAQANSFAFAASPS